MYTDGFVKKRQLNMNVAHFMSPVGEGSECSTRDAVVGSNTNTDEVVLRAYMINTSNIQDDGSDSDESSEDNDAQDDDEVESYQYGPDKMMWCTVCNLNVRKDNHPYCHSYRDTSGDDSGGGAHAEDHDAHRYVYCTECKRNVTLAQSLNLSCHTHCLDCGGDGPHDNCIKHNSKATKKRQLKTMYIYV